MHVLLGILFLLIVVALLVVYVIAAYMAMVLIQRTICRFKKTHGDDDSQKVTKRLWPYYSKRTYAKIIILVSLVAVSLYIMQRIEWTGKGSAHPEAKEYFVAGQTLAALRFAGTHVLHPENILLWPCNRLQHVIYEMGTRYLPKDDGEIGVWTDMWFLYPYSRDMTLPKVSISDPEATKHTHFVEGVFQANQMFPQIISILDSSWSALETMSTKPFADKNMQRQYYLNFVRAATYYHIYDGFYTGKYVGGSEKLFRDPLHIKRRELLLNWLAALKDRWEKEGLYGTMWEKYPKVEAGRQILRLSILQQFWEILAFRGDFGCDHPLIKDLHHAYADLMSGDYSSNILLHYSRSNMREASIMYEQNVYGPPGERAQYLLTEICHLGLPKERLILITRNRADFKWKEPWIAVDTILNSNKGRR